MRIWDESHRIRILGNIGGTRGLPVDHPKTWLSEVDVLLNQGRKCEIPTSELWIWTQPFTVAQVTEPIQCVLQQPGLPPTSACWSDIDCIQFLDWSGMLQNIVARRDYQGHTMQYIYIYVCMYVYIYICHYHYMSIALSLSLSDSKVWWFIAIAAMVPSLQKSFICSAGKASFLLHRPT